MFIGMVILANRWAEGKLDKPIKKLGQFKRRYGIFTMVLILVWWLLTPSGLPDDFITLWLINQYGMTAYVLSVAALTVYLLWRLKVTIVIYKAKRR